MCRGIGHLSENRIVLLSTFVAVSLRSLLCILVLSLDEDARDGEDLGDDDGDGDDDDDHDHVDGDDD